MNKSPFIEKEEDFNTIVERMSQIFQLNRRLPDQVFKEGYGNFNIIDFGPMMWSDFWHVLQACGRTAGDNEINMLLCQPDPVNYYFKHFKRYGALNFDISATATDYSEALRAEPPGSPADAFETNSFVWTWCGDSMKWGFYGIREVPEIGIGAACVEGFLWPQVKGISWFNIDDALAGLVSVVFRGHESEFREFSEAFRKNYLKGTSKNSP